MSADKVLEKEMDDVLKEAGIEKDGSKSALSAGLSCEWKSFARWPHDDGKVTCGYCADERDKNT